MGVLFPERTVQVEPTPFRHGSQCACITVTVSDAAKSRFFHSVAATSRSYAEQWGRRESIAERSA
jgi:hypothetical protein